MNDNIERRIVNGEMRVKGEPGERRQLTGHGAVFNSLSEDLGGFKEIIAPGAFSETLGADVRSLFNHDPNMVLGRTAAGTMRLSEDEIGLVYEVDLPETQAARDLETSIGRGDVTQSSFGFRVLEESWQNPTEDQPVPVRVLRRVELYDVGPVTFPAYTATSVTSRALDMAKQISSDAEGSAGPGSDNGAGLEIARRRLQLLGD